MPQAFPLAPDDTFLIMPPSVASGTKVVLGPAAIGGAQEKTFYVVFSETAVSGTVVVETAHSPGHAGPWAFLGEAVCTARGQVVCLSIPGVHLAVQVRIDKMIIHGTASVYAVGS